MKMNKTLFSYILIIGIAGTAGATTGIVGKRVFGQEEIDYTGFNPESLRMDGAALVEEYDSNPSKTYSAAELINIGLQKYKQCENSYSIGIGLADTVVAQTIRNFQIKNGNKYFEESISKSSMVALANRAFQDGKDGNIVLSLGKPSNEDTASYPENGKEYSKEDYKTYLGKTLDEMFIYLIHNNSMNKEGTSIEKLLNGDVKVTASLNPDIATYYYKIQMKNISNLDRLPSFSNLTHVYTFDKNMMLKHLYADETYSASMGISVTIHNTIDYYYYPNEYREIPQYNEKLDYSIKGEE
jgi:hypothetical protein